MAKRQERVVAASFVVRLVSFLAVLAVLAWWKSELAGLQQFFDQVSENPYGVLSTLASAATHMAQRVVYQKDIVPLLELFAVLKVSEVLVYVYGVCHSRLNHLHEYDEYPTPRYPLSGGGSKRPRKTIGQCPPPYPNGWFRVMDVEDMPPVGQTCHVAVWGQHLALFRVSDGSVKALDAYCPHLGANLGEGGKVVDDCVECPFHGWRFNGDGKCTHIPYAERIPATATVKSYHVKEAHQQVYVWFDAEGRNPLYPCPVESRITNGSFAYHGRSQEHINCHVQEIPENGADTAHLNVLHAPFFAPMGPLARFMGHGWTASWAAGKGDCPHYSDMHVDQWWTIGGFKVPGTLVKVDVSQMGPGIVHLEFHLGFGTVFIIETVTPAAPLVQKYHHAVFASWSVPRFLAKGVLRGLVAQANTDIMVWNHKKFEHKPMIVKGDGPLMRFRSWYKQFYSEHSKTMEQARDETLEW